MRGLRGREILRGTRDFGGVKGTRSREVDGVWETGEVLRVEGALETRGARDLRGTRDASGT